MVRKKHNLSQVLFLSLGYSVLTTVFDRYKQSSQFVTLEAITSMTPSAHA